MRETETPKAARRWLAERGDRRSSHASAAHQPGLSAAVDSLRILPEGAPAVGASASDGRDFLLVEVCHCLVGGSSLGEDLAAAVFAGVGSFVRECLDLSGDEPYYNHGRELLIGLFGLPKCIRIYRLIFRAPFLGRLRIRRQGNRVLSRELERRARATQVPARPLAIRRRACFRRLLPFHLARNSSIRSTTHLRPTAPINSRGDTSATTNARLARPLGATPAGHHAV